MHMKTSNFSQNKTQDIIKKFIFQFLLNVIKIRQIAKKSVKWSKNPQNSKNLEISIKFTLLTHKRQPVSNKLENNHSYNQLLLTKNTATKLTEVGIESEEKNWRQPNFSYVSEVPKCQILSVVSLDSL